MHETEYVARPYFDNCKSFAAHLVDLVNCFLIEIMNTDKKEMTDGLLVTCLTSDAVAFDPNLAVLPCPFGFTMSFQQSATTCTFLSVKKAHYSSGSIKEPNCCIMKTHRF